MDDVFDLSGTDKDTEIEVANHEWLKQMRHVAICGEREAMSDAFDSRSSDIFDRALDAGFEAVRDLAVLKGRLLYYKSLQNTDGSSVDQILTDLDLLMRGVIQEFESDRDHPAASEIVLPSDLSDKVAKIKEEVHRLLAVNKERRQVLKAHALFGFSLWAGFLRESKTFSASQEHLLRLRFCLPITFHTFHSL
ncbi:hypothetical protein TcWFU_001867 [Taenia crassiceps]|uniref:Uncharacterized protein n=1 Tax=Taenia crassiceps TaxID=6207 RepID=A0ABR4QNU1_9CEST